MPTTTPMTVLECINWVLKRAGQNTISSLLMAPTPVRQTLDALNLVYSELITILPLPSLRQRTTVTLAANQATVELTPLGIQPESIGDHGFVRFILGTQAPVVLAPLSQQEALLRPVNSTAEQPTSYWLDASTLRIWPTPSQAITLDIGYTPTPARYLESDAAVAIPFPVSWHRVLLLGMLAHVQQFLGEGVYLDTFQQYDVAKQQLRAKCLYQQTPSRIWPTYYGYTQ